MSSPSAMLPRMTTTLAPRRTRLAYDLLPSPLGPLLAARSDSGLCALTFDVDVHRVSAASRLGNEPEVRRYPEALLEVRYQLAEYFDGARRSFDLAVDLRGVTPFQRSVLDATVRIPAGATVTYGELAKRVGRPRAARAVGGALQRNPVWIVIPCHRVTASDGSLTGYGGGLDRKASLLRLEATGWDGTTWDRKTSAAPSTPSASPT